MFDIDDFCRWWDNGTRLGELPEQISLVGLVSFGATPKKLTHGSELVVAMGRQILDMYESPWIVSGEFTGNPTQGFELERKSYLVSGLVKAGQVISTIQEAEAWRDAVSPRFVPTTLVIITDEMHSRSARRVSNRVWNGWWGLRLLKRLLGMPLVRVLVVTFPTREAIDPENPMTALRDQKLWVRNNVLRECFLMFVPFGYTIMKHLNIHQPIATDRGGE